MLPADFMARVVVWPGDDQAPGWINAHWLSPRGPGMRGRPFKHLSDFTSFVEYAANKPAIFKEIFFCLSTQKDHGKEYHGKYVAHRHASKAMAFKALWLDVDFGSGKAYATAREAIAAVHAFVKAAGLPPPSAIVHTGGGIHVYWISLFPLTPEQWRPLAEALKAEAVRLGLKCDPISADAARVLRVPGTFNNKTGSPRPVRLLHLATTDYDFTTAEFTQLAAKAPALPAAKITAPVTALALPPDFANGPSKMLAVLDPHADNIATGIGRYDPDVPLKLKEIYQGCFHFQSTLKDHGVSQSQGLWMLNALACTWIENGREVFHSMARAYPTYTHEESDKMFDRKVKDRAERSLGWPLCTSFEAEGAKCQSCPYRGRLKSPLNLAERAVTPVAQILPPLTDDPLDLPDRYTLDPEGRICEIVEKEDRHGNSVTSYVPLFWCKLRNFRAQGENRQLLFDTSLDMDKWGKVEISEAVDLINETTIIKALRKYGAKPNTDISPKRIITFMTSFMAKLDASRERQTSVPFGWLRENKDNEENTMPVGFAYGGRICLNDGKERLSGYSDRQLEAFYSPRGKDTPWWKLLKIVTDRHHPALECIIATSFAAPLSYATGLYNGVICSWSPDSGAHKSTSMALGAAVWGTPKLTKEKPSSSSKGVIHKMGLIKNLPVFWDEINTPEKMKDVIHILGSTEGSGGSKLTSGREFHIYDEWQTLMQVGSNRSMVEDLISSKSGTDAQMQRVFEYQVEKRTDTQKHYITDNLSNSLDYNYGQMGMKYSALLGNNAARIHKQVESTLEKFCTEVSVRSEERFRCAIAATVHMGAVLANELGCSFNTDELWDFLKDEFRKQRNKIGASDVIAGTGPNSANWLSHFFKTYNDNALWVNTMPPRQPGIPPAVAWVAGVNAQRPRPVHIRLAVSDRIIDVSRTKFFEWLVLKEATPSSVLGGLVRHYGATEPGRLNLAAGAGVLGGGREPIIRIPVPPGSPFEGDLYAHTPPDQQRQQTVSTGLVTATVIPIDRSKP